MSSRAVLGSIGGAAAAAATGTLVYRRFMARRARAADVLNTTLPVHSKWWRERFAQQGELDYVALGDSAAQGIGASAPSHSYVGRIAQHLRQKTHSTVAVKNLSVSGSTTHQCKVNQVPRLADYRADVVTVAIGANDIDSFNAKRFEKNIRVIYGALPPHAIVADLPFMVLPELERKVEVANEIVRRVAGELGLTVAPLYATTRRQGYLRTVRNSAADLFHPNDRGYEVWASAFFPAVEARLARIAADHATADDTASPRVTTAATKLAARAEAATCGAPPPDVGGSA